jgi:hypothetical protein
MREGAVCLTMIRMCRTVPPDKTLGCFDTSWDGIFGEWPEGLGFFFCPVPEKKALPHFCVGSCFVCRDQNSGRLKVGVEKV